MSRTVTNRLKALKFLQKNLKRHALSVAKVLAKETPGEIVYNIDKKNSGFDTLYKFPTNELSTLKKKKPERRALVDSGKLTNEKASWGVRRVSNGYKVFVKGARKKIAKYLQKGIESKSGLKRYIFTYFRDSYVPKWMKKIIKEESRKFFKKVAS